MTDVTRILSDIASGSSQAASELLPLVYAELRKLAAVRLKQETPGQTLDPTGLVHEAYLKLTGSSSETAWDSRAHFFAAAAESMRRILIDNARRKKAKRHGGDLKRIPLSEEVIPVDNDDDLLLLDAALDRLSEQQPDKAELVKLRYFAGMKMADLAAATGLSLATAERHWAYARAWLRCEVSRLRDESH